MLNIDIAHVVTRVRLDGSYPSSNVQKRNPRASNFASPPTMDSPAITSIFRRLLSHNTCSKIRYRPALGYSRQLTAYRQQRTIFGFGNRTEKRYGNATTEQSNEPAWRRRQDIIQDGKAEEYRVYPMVTADELRTRKQRPRRVKMLLRDFIEGDHSLFKLRTRRLTSFRQSIQPKLRLLFQTSCHLFTWRAFQLPHN